MSRPVRVSATLLFTGLAIAYLVWKIDIRETAEVVADANPWWFLLAVAIMTLTVIPMAERWRRLLASQGMREHLPWLTRAYFVSYTAGQILPTSIGGDAVRILETSRRHPARLGAISAIVLLERALGGAATVLLGAFGFLLAIGRYDVGAYLWIEGAFVFGTIFLAFLFFSRSARPLLRATAPLLRALRLERPDPRRLRRRPRLPRPPGPADRALLLHGRDPGRARARDLGVRPGRSGSSSRRGSTT